MLKKLMELAGLVILILAAVIGTVYVTKNTEFGQKMKDEAVEYLSQPGEAPQADLMVFNGSYEILNGTLEKTQIEVDDVNQIRDMEIHAGAVGVILGLSEDDSFYIETENIGRVQCYANENCLYVNALSPTELKEDMRGSKVKLYVPWMVYREIRAELGAGSLEADGIIAEKLTAKVDFGTGKYNGDVGELDLKVNGGNFSLEGTLQESAKVSCDAGNVKLTLKGQKEDYDYQFSCKAGSISLEGEKIATGLSEEKTIDNGSGKTIQYEGNASNLKINFAQ